MYYNIVIEEPGTEVFKTNFFEIQNVITLIKGAIDKCPEVSIKITKIEDEKDTIAKPKRKISSNYIYSR